jgi:hypothetical protein
MRRSAISQVSALLFEALGYIILQFDSVILMDGQTEVAIGWHMFRSHVRVLSFLTSLTPDTSD